MMPGVVLELLQVDTWNLESEDRMKLEFQQKRALEERGSEKCEH